MMVQIFRLFIVCLSPINNVLYISPHFLLAHSCICDVTMFSLLRVACPVGKYLVFSNAGCLYVFMMYSLCVTLVTSTVF